MHRDLRIALLTAGAVLGFASGMHALHVRNMERRLAWERHITGLCVEAARHAPSSPVLPGDEPER